MDLYPLSTNANLACICPVDAEDDPGNLGSSGTDQASKSEDLAPSNLEADILKYSPACQMLHNEDFFSRLNIPLRIERSQLASNHLTDDLIDGQFTYGSGGDPSAIAKNCDTVGDLKYFFQAVADEEDSNSSLAQSFGDHEKFLNLMRRKRRRWLIHDQNPRVEGEGFRDFYKLLFSDG